MWTYEPPSLSGIFDRTQFPRVYLDVEVCLSVNVVDLVDPRPQISIFEDRRGVTG